MAALDAHRTWLETTHSGNARQRARIAEELRGELRQALYDAASEELGAKIEETLRQVEGRSIDPYTATEALVGAFRDRDKA
jgi:hypothetical protein